MFNQGNIFNSFYYYSTTTLKNKCTLQVQLGNPNTEVSQNTVYSHLIVEQITEMCLKFHLGRPTKLISFSNAPLFLKITSL